MMSNEENSHASAGTVAVLAIKIKVTRIIVVQRAPKSKSAYTRGKN